MTRLPPVFLLTGEFPPRIGGIADYTARLAESLQDIGLHVTVLTGSNHPPANDAAVPVEHLSSAVNGWGLLRAVEQRIGTQCCFVHTQYQTAAFGMHPAINLLPDWLRRRRPNARTVVTCHDVRLPYLFPKAGSVRELVTHRMIDRSHAAIFADEADRQWAGAKSRHALVPIGSGVPVALRSGDTGLERGLFRLGYFGFMNASKGVATLLEAVSRLTNQGREIRLVLIGDALGASDPTNNEIRAGLDQEIHRLGLDGSIERTGTLSLREVSIELQRCDALVFPFDDGASFRRSSLTAALVHGRPVVTTLQPSGANGIPGFESGESVLLVPPRDPSAMATALAQLMDDAGLRARLSQGALRASERLQWSRIASAVCEVYESVFAEEPR